MKNLLTILFCAISTFGVSQTTIYEFKTFDERTDDSFVVIPMLGEVHIDEETKEISLITPDYYMVYNYISKQHFIRQNTFLVVAYDWRDEKIHIKIDKEDEYGDYITFYYYSDEQKMKYFRLCLEKCPLKYVP